MMQSFDATLFEVGFPRIVSALAEYGIAFDWREKERDRAMEVWLKWERLSNEEYDAIAHVLLKDIEPQLRETLDTSVPRQVREIEVAIETNLGETRRYIFDSIADAVDFLETLDVEAMLNDENGSALWIVNDSTDESSEG